MAWGVLVKGKMALNSKWKRAFFFIRDRRQWSWNLSSKKDRDPKDLLLDLEIDIVAAFERMVKKDKLLCFEEIVSNENLKKHRLMPSGLGATSSLVYF